MKLLPNSNGVYKVNMKTKKNPKEKLRSIFIIIFIILALGFVYQKINNFIIKETLKERVDYVRVDEKRLDFKIEGSGSNYTVVFDGNIGANLNQWNPIVETLTTDYDDLTTFVYNRRGYGFSDIGSIRTPKEQAEDLRILLRKSAAKAPYILVGEDYGSLVLTEFAKEYPDLVAGVILVNPLVEQEINTKEFKNKLFLERLRRKIESIGSNFAFTYLLDTINLDTKVEDFEKSLDENSLIEFKAHRTKSNYTKAVYNEILNITSGNNTSQQTEVFAGKPYYLIAKSNQESLEGLGDKDLTKLYTTNLDSDFISIDNQESVINGIRQVVKQANEIERTEKANKN
ncbi:alpha/beta hydrolase [Clostridium sp.]|uniref:alpha/beta fold hydrolase n=1 Tax=Clostridium sp. TaxID=1506 RepID=UPI0026178B6E|nr:alpha/beta hydrolase [Clostridium sp.]